MKYFLLGIGSTILARRYAEYRQEIQEIELQFAIMRAYGETMRGYTQR